MRPDTQADPEANDANQAAGAEPVPAGVKAAEDVKLLQFELVRLGRYHDLCQRSASLLHKLMAFLVIVLGSTAFSGMAANIAFLPEIAGFGIIVLGTVMMIWDFSGTAKTHELMKASAYDLLADVEGGQDAVSIEAAMTRLYAKEPPENRRINAKAHNRAGETVYGDDFERAVEISLWHSMLRLG